MKYLIILLFTLSTFIASAQVEKGNTSQVPAIQPMLEYYCNGRYDFCITFPEPYFDKKSYADNGDGLKLLSKDKDLLLTVAAEYNVLEQSMGEVYSNLVTELIDDGEEVLTLEKEATGNNLSATIKLTSSNVFVRLIDQQDYYVIILLRSDQLLPAQLAEIAKNIRFNRPS